MKSILIALSTLVLSLGLQAKTIQGVDFAESVDLGGKKLVLNGVGIRKATFFKVKVYVSGLYISKKESDPSKIAAQEGPKKISMQFLMGVERKKLTDAWSKSLSQHCPEDCSELKNGLAKMNSYMRNVRKKDRFEFDIYADKVVPTIQGKVKEEIKGASFGQALLKVFVGPKEIDAGMAKGLRGQ